MAVLHFERRHRCRATAFRRRPGCLDVLINNAGNVRAAPLEDIDVADIRAMVALNLLAPVPTTRAALPHLRAAGAARRNAALFGISSAAGLVGMPFYATYAATKAGVIRFGEALWRDLYSSGIHVAAVYLDPVDTPMMATPRAGADLGYGLRPVDEVVAEIVAGLEERRIDINTQLPDAVRCRSSTPGIHPPSTPPSRPSSPNSGPLSAPTAASEPQIPLPVCISTRSWTTTWSTCRRRYLRPPRGPRPLLPATHQAMVNATRPHRRRRPRCWNALPASRRETLDFPYSATIGGQFRDRSYG
nr:SDR family NAD(P)-dependent oxidoreductase [Amycolatopsis sp. SID8362]